VKPTVRVPPCFGVPAEGVEDVLVPELELPPDPQASRRVPAPTAPAMPAADPRKLRRENL
jgi:hypothetical protein